MKLPASVAVHTLAEEPLCLLAARARMCSRGSARCPAVPENPGVTIDDLRGRHVIMPSRGTALRALLDDAFAEVGFSPLPRFETSDPQMLRQLVSAGLGVSIVPRGWLLDGGPAVATSNSASPSRATASRCWRPRSLRLPARDRLVEHLQLVLGRPLERLLAGTSWRCPA